MSNQPGREDIAAVRPCGCWVMIMVVRSPRGNYTASHDDMSDFYARVAKYTTQKRNPLQLEVVTLRDGLLPPHKCSVCCPQETLFGAMK